MARRLVRHEVHPWPVRAQGCRLPQLDHGRRQRRRHQLKAEAGRYHLYVSLACPWAHRTLIMRALKGLEQIIPVSVTHWLMGEQGWSFAQGEGVVPDPLFSSRYVHEIYSRADPDYTGRATVPVLWDQHTQTIVNN